MLFAYQLLTGCSDALSGALLMLVPAAVLQLMHVRVQAKNLVFVGYIGAFVFPLGLSCLYGALLVYRGDTKRQLATVWLLTALMRASVAIFVTQQILVGTLTLGWLPVAAFDGTCVVIQAIGLRKGWMSHATR